jgi:chromosome segregation ATPase
MDAATKQLKIAQLKQKIANAQSRLSGHQADHQRTQAAIDQQTQDVQSDEEQRAATQRDLKELSQKIDDHTTAYKKTNNLTEAMVSLVSGAKSTAAQASSMTNVRGARSFAKGLEQLHSGPVHAKAANNLSDNHDTLYKQLRKLQAQDSDDRKKEKHLNTAISEGKKNLANLKSALSGHASKISACQQEISAYQAELRTLQNS